MTLHNIDQQTTLYIIAVSERPLHCYAIAREYIKAGINREVSVIAKKVRKHVAALMYEDRIYCTNPTYQRGYTYKLKETK